MSRDSKFFLIILIVIIVGGAAAFIGVRNFTPISMTSRPTVSMANKTASDFELELFTGGKIKLSDFKGKKPVVVNFWASWCGPCRTEGSTLARVSSEAGDRVEFIGIAVNDGRNEAIAFMKEFGITYKNGQDKSGIDRDYKISGLPETFFIDKNGEIVDHWIGAIDEAGMVERVNRLINGSGRSAQ